MEKADEQQAAAEVGGFQVAFKIPGRVSLGASEGAKSLRISSAIIAPDFTVRAVPVLDPTAFLEASFKQTEERPCCRPGCDYRDGMFVGRGLMAAAARMRPCGSASAPTTRSRSSAPSSSATRALPA